MKEKIVIYKFFDDATKFRYLGKKVTNRSYILKDMGNP
jgi:hypothetical protein